MYTGNERLIIAGKELQYSMLNFWQTSYSDILLNMNRGTFAEFIVRCALNERGLPTFNKTMTGIEPFDMEGPEFASESGVRPCRIEVKCSAYPSDDQRRTSGSGLCLAESCVQQACEGRKSRFDSEQFIWDDGHQLRVGGNTI